MAQSQRYVTRQSEVVVNSGRAYTRGAGSLSTCGSANKAGWDEKGGERTERQALNRVLPVSRSRHEVVPPACAAICMLQSCNQALLPAPTDLTIRPACMSIGGKTAIKQALTFDTEKEHVCRRTESVSIGTCPHIKQRLNPI